VRSEAHVGMCGLVINPGTNNWGSRSRVHVLVGVWRFPRLHLSHDQDSLHGLHPNDRRHKARGAFLLRQLGTLGWLGS